MKSATRRCGKTRLFRLTTALVRKSFSCTNVSPAAIYRAVDLWHPTLLIDEADTFVGISPELTGILNSGHAKSSAFVVRCVGDDHTPTKFSTWCPKALAGIGRLPSTLEDRSIVIPLAMKRTGQKVVPISEVELQATAARIRSQLLRWAQDTAGFGLQLWPEVPRELHDRAADNWRPLIAIANYAGGAWPERARNAAIALTPSGDDSADVATMLLSDLRDLFAEYGPVLASDFIVNRLAEMEGRPWAEYIRSSPITKTQLAVALRPFEVKPCKIRIDSKTTIRGYRAESFKDIFAAYFPEPERPEQMEQLEDAMINTDERTPANIQG